MDQERRIKQASDIARVDAEGKSTHELVMLILTNHLPHIYERLGKIEVRLAYYAGSAAVGASVIGALINHYWN